MKQITSKELKNLITENKQVLVEYFADWCGPCKVLLPKLENLEKEYNNTVFVKINIDDETDHCRELNIRSIPNVMIYKNGEISNNILGNKDINEYKQFL